MASPPRPPPPPKGPGVPSGALLVQTRIIITGTRPELQAARALLESGELREAARVLEHSGAHAPAAMLRLEHAAQGGGQNLLQRITMLREGCARNSGETEEGRALHRALAEALLRQAEVMEDGAPRRAFLIEAARALEEADRGADAGMIYERLGLWRRAAHAYEKAGALSQLEYALEIIERQESAHAAIAAAERAVDDALRIGQRRLAHTLASEYTSERFQMGAQRERLPRLGLVQRLGAIEAALPAIERLRVRWNGQEPGQLLWGPRLRIGRAPDVEIPLSAPALSRVHVILQLAPRLPPAPPGVALVAIDQASRVGTFWEGDALTAGEPTPLDAPGTLGLGFGDTVAVTPLREDGSACGALVRPQSAPGWTLFLPGGGPLYRDPERRLPVRLILTPPFVAIAAEPGVRLRLGATLLEPGARVEILIGDRLEILPEGEAPTTLELLG
ncbi:MAG: hypothetical protein R3B09_31145 [Nannocystaceae bacterium]